LAQAIISFNDVSKRYPGAGEALAGIDLDIAAGEFVLLTGHSGAGKSTLLKLIAAIERASSGTILVNGQNVSALAARGIPFLRRNLGLIFQDQKLLFDRSVLDNVLLPMQIAGHPWRDAHKRARAALDKVGLLERERANPVALSGGEQQRLCIARAVVNRPAILIADEPTASLDDEYAEAIVDMFQSFNQVGVTVLVATHDRSLMSRRSPRVISLKHGRLDIPEAA
jgi:cell division transport system ATP-binding protein